MSGGARAPRLWLRALEPSDEVRFKQAVRSFARSDPDRDFAFDFDPDGDFREFCERLRNHQYGVGIPDGWVPNTFLVAIVAGKLVGRVSLRHQLNDFLRELGGHVGYGVVAEHRGRGFATEMLAGTLPIARRVGIDRLWVTCDETNHASTKVIERNGGVLEDIYTSAGSRVAKRRYWIDLRETAEGA